MAASRVAMVSAVERTRRRDWVEVCVAYGLVLLVIWTPRPWQRMLYWTPVAWIAVTSWLRFESLRAMGWRTVNLVRSLWIVGVAALLAAIAVLVAIRMGTLHAPPGPIAFFQTYVGYAIWSFVQQFLMLDYFLGRLSRLMPSAQWAVVATAGIFAFAHLPNPVLTPLTMIWGLAACWIFVKYRNLWPLGLAHAIFGICVAVTVPGSMTHNMRVGAGYLGYHRRHAVQRNQSDQMVSTQAWVKADAATRRF